MRLRFGLVLSVTLLGSASAFAVTVTNKDDKEHKLTILEGDAKQELQLKPSGVLEGVCLKGCTIRLGSSEDDEYVLEGPEVISIEDSKLYDDAPETK
ncbi:MAG: hypothetical protein ABL901_07245 [Hyphomicrobiaceae bacterium]